MNSPVTVFVLAYNRPDYLLECLHSIVHQTLSNFRIVVLDNASATDLQPIIEQVRYQSGKVIEYLRHPRNIESIGNFRHAWYYSKTTPYFVIFHDDDIMHPEFLERSLAAMKHSGAPAWAGSQSKAFTGSAPSFPALGADMPMYLSASELAYRLLTQRCNVTFSTVIYRSDLVDSIDICALSERHSILADRPLLFALAERHGCSLSPLPLVLYRCHPAQDSTNGPLNEDNLFSLFTAYRQVLQPLWSEQVERDFYAWSGFHIPDGYSRLTVTKRSSLREYLQKARAMGVYRDRYFSRYLLGLVYGFFCRLRRAFAKLQQPLGEWMCFRR